jgi:4-diphosphocytidyl-2-C-methyl-D-erythritol kinase
MTGTAGRDHPAGRTARTVAQAKLNLFLRVLAREASGYHQLETLFCRLELGDAVTIRTDVRGRSFDCTGDVIPPAGLGLTERNLAWRAAVAYTDATGWPNEWAIEIVKTIPVGGGLGGGSADAGAVLRCLNALAPSPLAVHELLALAGPLGADVPFLCIDDPLALAWGRGERMLALPPLPSRAVTLVCFPFGVSTPDAYGWLDAAEGATRSRSASMSVDALTTWEGVATIAHNDFEAVVAPRYVEIERALAEMRSLPTGAIGSSPITLLAGSGATVFSIAEDFPPAMRALHGAASRIVRTRTASRVVAVEVSD